MASADWTLNSEPSTLKQVARLVAEATGVLDNTELFRSASRDLFNLILCIFNTLLVWEEICEETTVVLVCTEYSVQHLEDLSEEGISRSSRPIIVITLDHLIIKKGARTSKWDRALVHGPRSKIIMIHANHLCSP